MKVPKKFYIFIILLMYLIIINLPLFLMNVLPWEDKPYTDIQLEKARTWCQSELKKGYPLKELSNIEWKGKVNKLIGSNFYMEIKGTILNVNGQAIVFLNTVLIDKQLKGVDYAVVLLHELVHIKKFQGNERKTSWISFKISQGSDDPYIKYISASTALRSLCIHDHYSFNGYLINYLEQENLITK